MIGTRLTRRDETCTPGTAVLGQTRHRLLENVVEKMCSAAPQRDVDDGSEEEVDTLRNDGSTGRALCELPPLTRCGPTPQLTYLRAAHQTYLCALGHCRTHPLTLYLKQRLCGTRDGKQKQCTEAAAEFADLFAGDLLREDAAVVAWAKKAVKLPRARGKKR